MISDVVVPLEIVSIAMPGGMTGARTVAAGGLPVRGRAAQAGVFARERERDDRADG